jgi:hypothetical protein
MMIMFLPCYYCDAHIPTQTKQRNKEIYIINTATMKPSGVRLFEEVEHQHGNKKDEGKQSRTHEIQKLEVGILQKSHVVFPVRVLAIKKNVGLK